MPTVRVTVYLLTRILHYLFSCPKSPLRSRPALSKYRLTIGILSLLIELFSERSFHPQVKFTAFGSAIR